MTCWLGLLGRRQEIPSAFQALRDLCACNSPQLPATLLQRSALGHLNIMPNFTQEASWNYEIGFIPFVGDGYARGVEGIRVLLIFPY